MIFDRPAIIKLVVGVALFMVAAIAGGLLDNYQLQVGTSLAMLSVLCMGWNITGGYMGYPMLGMAAFFGLGCYIDAIAQVAGIPVVVAWLLATAGGALTAALLGLALLRLKGHYFAIGTIAIVEVLREVSNNWESLTGGAVGLNVPILQGDPETVGRFFYLAMATLALLAFLITIMIDRSRFGFGLRCIRQNEQAASMVGIDVFRYKVAAFMLSGALGSAAGAVYASMVAFIEPKDAFSLIMTIEVAVMTMLGGMGTIFGPLAGAVFFVVLREFVWANFINWHSGILGLIVVIVIYFVPGGLFGTNWKALFRRAARPRASVRSQPAL